MCMVDLAINNRAFWQPVTNVTVGKSGNAVIPRNFNRIALVVADATSGNPVFVRMVSTLTGPVINMLFDTGTGDQWLRQVITIHKAPAINAVDLYCDVAPGSITVMECIIDPDTSSAVQKVSAEFGR